MFYFVGSVSNNFASSIEMIGVQKNCKSVSMQISCYWIFSHIYNMFKDEVIFCAKYNILTSLRSQIVDIYWTIFLCLISTIFIAVAYNSNSIHDMKPLRQKVTWEKLYRCELSKYPQVATLCILIISSNNNHLKVRSHDGSSSFDQPNT